MTFQDFKKLITTYPEMTKTVYNIQIEIQEARAAADALLDGVSSVNLTDMPKSLRLSDDTYNRVQKRVDVYEQRINHLLMNIEKIQHKQSYITDLIRELEPEEKEIITERYIKGTKWDYVPDKVCMSRRKCFYLHDKAINKMIQAE